MHKDNMHIRSKCIRIKDDMHMLCKMFSYKSQLWATAIEEEKTKDIICLEHSQGHQNSPVLETKGLKVQGTKK